MAICAPNLLKIHSSLTCVRSNEKFQPSKATTSSLRMSAAPFRVARLRAQAVSGSRGCTQFLGSRMTYLDDFNSKIKGSMTSHHTRRVVTTAFIERFSERAIMAVTAAQEEAKRIDSSIVNTEQILVGLTYGSEDIAATVLNAAGLHKDKTQIVVERIVGKGIAPSPQEIPFSEDAKRVLRLALEESRKYDDVFIGSEYVLLALLTVIEDETDSVVLRVFSLYGIDHNEIRKKVLEIIAEREEARKKNK